MLLFVVFVPYYFMVCPKYSNFRENRDTALLHAPKATSTEGKNTFSNMGGVVLFPAARTRSKETIAGLAALLRDRFLVCCSILPTSGDAFLHLSIHLGVISYRNSSLN